MKCHWVDIVGGMFLVSASATFLSLAAYLARLTFWGAP